jgi:hypothetical protein
MRKTILLLALFSVIIVLTSCQKAEEITVTKYFQAMQHNDRVTMGTMAVEPKALQFKAFKIVSISEPEEKPLILPDLEKKMRALEEQKRDQANKTLDASDHVEELKDQLEETRRRDKIAELKKEIEAAEATIKEERDKYLAVNNKLITMKKKIEAEKNMITSSTSNLVDKNFELYQGKTMLYKVIVNVTLANDEVKDYVFILRKDALTLENRPIPSRQIITKIATVEEYEQELKQQEEEEMTESQEVTEPEPAGQTTPEEE